MTPFMQTSRKQALALILSATCLFAITGCAKNYSPDVYSPGGMQQASKVDRAIVRSVRQVDVDDPSLGLGTAAGAAGGGIAGSQIGRGGGNAAAVLGGVLIGGAIGWLIDHEANATTAYEYILEKQTCKPECKPSGDLMTLAQKQDQPFAPDTHVLILYGTKARIVPNTFDVGTATVKGAQ